MIRRIAAAGTILLLAAGLAAPAAAESEPGAAPAATGYLADFGRDFDGTSEKILSLAGAIPADKYGWAPSPEVRNVSRSLVHVAMANFFFASQFGVAMPEGLGRDAEETITGKDEVIELFKSSLGHMGEALARAAEMDLDEEVELFGGKRSRRMVLMIAAGHGHEHLGQLIAYARSNGVAPPWSGGGG